MRILLTVAELRAARSELLQRDATATLGLVPTMGALHDGHLALVRAAKERCRFVAVSIFVNPLQFGPSEDFSHYPRTFDQDCTLLLKEGVDLVFAPAAEELVPAHATTFIQVGGIGDRLDGKSRPGHFRGVTTIVGKLFHVVAPHAAFFGQKDAAQVAVLRAMVRDLNFDLDLVVCPTVREPDGLALSSRNRYLSAEERIHALALSRALQSIASMSVQEKDARVLQEHLRSCLAAAEGIRLDYAEVVDPRTLEAITTMHKGALVAVAAYVGKTRLIDNIVLPSGNTP
ncbi:pantoate--beta-alanine ligase [Terriglobus saanensis]|uniref:Pantothenate synthetase n=1 Tax=Terriglobus saanensis (strain ATCC BAA-1853 / DSM 23119 / SP1PR4) TaxID=401053 RepID=E8UZX8_TERSS|nr:pantoate--beta-alanine ligase [Terriglobus saanensis]ADV81055.1 pantoate/beta-alanine ligase [Terriglobus saanensis SP1PR4]